MSKKSKKALTIALVVLLVLACAGTAVVGVFSQGFKDWSKFEDAFGIEKPADPDQAEDPDQTEDPDQGETPDEGEDPGAEEPPVEGPEQQYYTFSRELTCLDDLIGLTYDSEYDWTMVEKLNTTPSQEIYSYISFIYVEGFSAPFADFEEYVDTLTHAKALKVKINGEPMTLVNSGAGRGSIPFVAVDKITTVFFSEEFQELPLKTLMLGAQSETEIESLEIVEIVENIELVLEDYHELAGMMFDMASDGVFYYEIEEGSILSIYIAAEDREKYFYDIADITSITVKIDDVEHELPCVYDGWGPNGYTYANDEVGLYIGYADIAPDNFTGTAITVVAREASFATFEIVSFNH